MKTTMLRVALAAAFLFVVSGCNQMAGDIGARCSSNGDCIHTLTCRHDPGGIFDGQCTSSCGSCAECESLYGSSSAACLAIGFCVLYCGTRDPSHTHITCPSGTHCNSSGWCESP